MPNDYTEYRQFFKNLDLLSHELQHGDAEKNLFDMTRNLLVIEPHANAKSLNVCNSVELLAETYLTN